jgi:hypothetical protein
MKLFIAALLVFTATHVVGQPGAGLASAQTTGAAVATIDQELEIVRQSNNPKVQVKFSALNTPAELEVINGEGAQLLNVPVAANTTNVEVNIQSMPAGLYFVRLLVDGNSIAIKSLWID